MAQRGVPLMVMRRIQGHGRGWVFTPRDFLDLGSRASVDQALRRLSVAELRRDPQTEGHLDLRRIAFGIYDYPRWDLDGSAPLPEPEALAATIARRDGHRVTKSGAHHAHDLGLTELGQGARHIFLTDGPDRLYDLGVRQLEMRHAGPRTMAWAGHSGAPIVLALAWLGPQLIEPAKDTLRKRGLADATRRDLQKNIWMAPSYMQPALRELVGRQSPRRRKRTRAPAQGRAPATT